MPVATEITIDLDEAHCFLNALAGPNHVFQILPERKGCRVRPHTLQGDFDQHKKALAHANRNGAGIFVCVNRAVGGRRKEHIEAVRSLFLDLDGSPLDPVLSSDLPPDMVTETSPGRFHCFWITDTIPLSEYRAAQMKLIEKFDGDPACKDLGRCTRVAGFIHRKKEPFMTRVIRIREEISGYA